MNSLKQIDLQDPLVPLASNSLSDRIADRIVDAIALGKLKSGERLNEVELAEALGVSRVPIREATRILASQGIVVPSPRRGMRVGVFDASWAKQLHNARVAIERLAARTVADKLRDNEQLAEPLRVAAARIRQVATRSPLDPYEVNRADIAFHATLFELADSPFLTTLWSAIARHVLIMFAIETYRSTDLQSVAKQHDTYIDTLLHGSAAQLEIEIENHVAGVQVFAKTENQ